MNRSALVFLLSMGLPFALAACPTPDDDDVVADDDTAGDDDDALPDEYTFEAEEGGPEGVVCREPDPAPADGALCSTEPGSGALYLRGIVLAPGQVLMGGEVLLASGGSIECVGCDCSASASAAGATRVTCPWGVVSPGLINAHDHISYTQNRPSTHEGIRYGHRHDWRVGNNGFDPLPYEGSATTEEKAWGELRFVMGGATSILGSGSSDGLLRNLDTDQEGLWQGDVGYQTFPLGDSNGTTRTAGCDYPDIDSPSVLDDDAYVPHISEGIDLAARNELLCLSSNDGGGEDLTEENTAIIHAVGIDATDAAMLAYEGAKVIWSARTNIDLYGNTAPVTMLDTLGVPIGLGTDWTPSGSMNMLRELACADHLNQQSYGGWFGDWQLWEMATWGAALACEVQDATGSLAVGLAGDVAVFDGRHQPARPFRAIIESDPGGVALVVRGGEILAGDSALVAALPSGGEGCDELPTDVCGVAKRACVQQQVGMSFASLASANTDSYYLFSCGDAEDEPSCEPFRPGEYDGPTSTDADGDGIDDEDDLCPTVFDPVRPMDGGVQRDNDGDLAGDVCDPCPLGEDGDGDCLPFDPADRDGDGHANELDNCPMTANPGQENLDGDDMGDACDACPEEWNEPGRACPATIYEIKQGLLDVGHPVALSNVVVTAVGGYGFFIEVQDADLDPVLGRSFSGLFVYGSTDTPPVQGDVISLDGLVGNWYDQWELTSPSQMTVEATAQPLPAPVEVLPAEVTTGGLLAWDYEGVLVVTQGEVTSYDPPAGAGDSDPTGEFLIDETLRVNDYLVSLEPRPTIGDTVQVAGVLRFANEDSKLEPRSLDDIVTLLVGPPQLDSFGPAAAFAYLADTDVSALPAALMVVLDRPAPAGGTVVTLTAADPSVLGVPASVTIPEGLTEAEVLLSGLLVGTSQLDAFLDPDTLSVQVEILDPARVPLLVGLEPGSVMVGLGQTEGLSVSLDIPAPAGGTTVGLSMAPGTFASVPASVVVAQGALAAAFDVTGTAEGIDTLSATLDAVTLQATIDVQALPMVGLILTEVFYDPGSSDDGKEWVEIYNGTWDTIDLSGYSIGAGGSDYTYSQLDLSGTIAPGECQVIGGPTTDASNFSPVYAYAADFAPDLQNSGDTADGVALFDQPSSAVGPSTAPIDSVLYGTTNDSGLIDSTGAAAAVDVTDVASDHSIERTATGWQNQVAPTPNDCTAAF